MELTFFANFSVAVRQRICGGMENCMCFFVMPDSILSTYLYFVEQLSKLTTISISSMPPSIRRPSQSNHHSIERFKCKRRHKSQYFRVVNVRLNREVIDR